MPTNKMERFTQRARRILSLAQEAAEALKHNVIDTEHMLLALMREQGGVAGLVLRDLGLEQGRVEALVEELTRATARTTNTALDLSPGTKKMLELAVDEARRMGHHYIGTEHLLLGLARQADGVAIEVLKRLGVSMEEIQQQTRRVLQEQPRQDKQVPSPERVRVPTNPMLHIRVFDDETGTVKSDLALRFGIIHDMVQLIRYMMDQGVMNKFALFDKDHAQRLEINFDEDAPPPTVESGTEDAL